MKKLALLFTLLPAISFADQNLSDDIWDISFSKEAMSDNISVFMLTQSLDPYEIYGQPKRANLIIRCLDNTTDLFISYPDVYLHNRNVKVEYRLDQDKSIKTTWGVSSNYESTFASNPVSVIKSMFNKDRMLVRLTPYSKSPIMLSFNISGLKTSIEPLRKACKW